MSGARAQAVREQEIVAKWATGLYTPEATSWVKVKNPAYLQAEGRPISSMGGLAKASNYFLFTNGEAEDWIDKTVGVRTISSFTLKQWIAECKRLKALNEQVTG